MALTTASTVLLENASATSPWLYYPGGAAVYTFMTTGGTVALEQLGPDGLTSVTVSAAAAGPVGRVNLITLAPGQYRAVVAGGGTAVWARIDRVP